MSIFKKLEVVTVSRGPFDRLQKLKVVTIPCDPRRSPPKTNGVLSDIISIVKRIESGHCFWWSPWIALKNKWYSHAVPLTGVDMLNLRGWFRHEFAQKKKEPESISILKWIESGHCFWWSPWIALKNEWFSHAVPLTGVDVLNLRGWFRHEFAQKKKKNPKAFPF